MGKNEAAILVVDDESKIGKIISDILTFKGYRVIVCLSGEEALKILTKKNIDLILADLMMPGITGKEVLNHVTRNYPEIPVVIISAYGSVKVAVEAIKEGAYDFIEKPLDADRLLITIKNALEKRNLSLKTKRLQEDIVSRYQMIGNSPAIHHVFKQIEIFAPTNSKVLITGESGTGKDLVAQALHNLSPRVGFPFVKINCAAIPDSLVESELFGYEKGAFTGAAASTKGRIERAHQGSLFLDEIGDLKLELQAKLLRVIENQEFERLGSLKTIKIDFRLITATNKDLELDVKEGRFREDLYYRLKTSHIHLAPLRERKEDIPQLAQYFLDQFCEENNLAVKHISNNVLKDLNDHNWPGNIRELKNYIYN
ncbi:MAG: sigma-54 dependent transcriptional regulator, partial [Calditrichales bacterium]|nr:sigma-54 dependent transcriptional regulator [Calditrichales bacterium]